MGCHRTSWIATTLRSSAPGYQGRKAVLLLAFALTGCQASPYRAADLPAHLRAAPTHRSKDLDLTRLAGQGVGTSEIGPGDLVELTITSGRGDETTEPSSMRVARDGRLAVPLVGWVPVAGLEPVEAEQRIAAAAVERDIYRQPLVTLQVTEQAVNRITVLGAVDSPGVYSLPRGSSDLANAIAMAGGMTEEAGSKVDVLRHDSPSFLADGSPPFADPAEVGVVLASYDGVPAPGESPQTATTAARPGPPGTAPIRSIRIDLAQAEPSRNNQHHLNDRDVVMVLPQEQQLIHVTGLVKRADQFHLPRDQEVRVLDAIALAGGVSSPVADKVFIIRRMADMPEPIVIRVSMRKAKQNGDENIRLTAGDLVSVETTPATTLVETANMFFRMTLGLGSNVTIF
jgi:polysaccharide export outer membrane protein